MKTVEFAIYCYLSDKERLENFVRKNLIIKELEWEYLQREITDPEVPVALYVVCEWQPNDFQI